MLVYYHYYYCYYTLGRKERKVNPLREKPAMEIQPVVFHKHSKTVTIGATKGTSQTPITLDTSAAMTGTSATYKFSDDLHGQGSLFDDKSSKVAPSSGHTPVMVK